MATTQRILPPRAFRVVLFWPFILAWRLVTFITNLIGILLALVIGLALMMLGIFLSSTIIGIVVGVPVFILGLLLLVRAIY
jgi:hypothetical protein